jgi:hypothetical protein
MAVGEMDTVERRVDELLEVLDADIQHLERTLSQLDSLRSSLIKRDDTALNALLTDLQGQIDQHAANERRRQELRTDLARSLGCLADDLTLSVLKLRVPSSRRSLLAGRQKMLASLVRQLKREYTLTVALVSDCARFNRLLVRAIFGTGAETGTTYGAAGTATHQTNASMVSLRI